MMHLSRVHFLNTCACDNTIYRTPLAVIDDYSLASAKGCWLALLPSFVTKETFPFTFTYRRKAEKGGVEKNSQRFQFCIANTTSQIRSRSTSTIRVPQFLFIVLDGKVRELGAL